MAFDLRRFYRGIPGQPAKQGENPVIPHPEHRDHPVVEELVRGPHKRDPRPEVIKPFEHVPKAQLNRIYGSLRAEGNWQYNVDNYAKGGITTVQSTLVQSSVLLALTLPETRQMRWPGAVSMYLAIRSFAIAPSTASFATAGSVDLYYQDIIGGQTIPLACMINNAAFSMEDCCILIPTPITDPGQLSAPIGNIQATLSAAGTVGTYIWQIAFSLAYLLPTTKPYDIQHIEELLDAHPGHVHHSE